MIADDKLCRCRPSLGGGQCMKEANCLVSDYLCRREVKRYPCPGPDWRVDLRVARLAGLAIVCVVALAGCASHLAPDLNALCAHHGGIASVSTYVQNGDHHLVVCRDGLARDDG